MRGGGVRSRRLVPVQLDQSRSRTPPRPPALGRGLRSSRSVRGRPLFPRELPRETLGGTRRGCRQPAGGRFSFGSRRIGPIPPLGGGAKSRRAPAELGPAEYPDQEQEAAQGTPAPPPACPASPLGSTSLRAPRFSADRGHRQSGHPQGLRGCGNGGDEGGFLPPLVNSSNTILIYNMANYANEDEKYQELQEMPLEHQMEERLVEALVTMCKTP
ncbi:hypothetical protein NDU88_000760 [Pleurodeles waltl]|uniref:Uncharacterized protein n=1 Tax=Pleurodeles waltl TaxID=8319 RepID=A0AAV7NAG4_PLEWA|nr:hypothetical protein NDU88_000760 [Pleurodeles waltl]